MINFDDKMSCGVRIQIIQAEPDQIVLFRLSPPEGQKLSNVAQVKDDKITIAIDPESIPALKRVLRALVGRDSLLDCIKNLFR